MRARSVNIKSKMLREAKTFAGDKIFPPQIIHTQPKLN